MKTTTVSTEPATLAIGEFRIQARRLLKTLRSAEEPACQEAAARFTRLESFAGRSLSQILERRDRVRLKHALTVLALEQGHPTWPALKASLEEAGTSPGTAPASPPRPLPDEAELMYDRRLDVLLNRWFAHYDQAEASLREEGGYLFPYRHHFYICEAEGVRILGLDPDDPDWTAIGWNWSAPEDREAWGRLRQKRLRALRSLTPPAPPSSPLTTA